MRTTEANDALRNRQFPCEIWYPSEPRTNQAGELRDASPVAGNSPLVLFSHSSGGNRRQSSFLCTHLASHGYVVAAIDHSEIVAAELARKDGETEAERDGRGEAWIANRVPDIQFLLDHLLGSAVLESVTFDERRIAIVGHSFGGWTVLATPDVDRRIHAIAALAPAGATKRKPGVIPVTLSFKWRRDIPTLYLVAENDSALPLAGMYELLERTPSTKRMFVLRRADHLHFMDDVETLHEAIRKMPYPGADEMRPIAELCTARQAHLFVRGLALAHFDATLRENEAARQFLNSEVESALSRLDIPAFVEPRSGGTL